ncbi:hypothetical protein O9H85_02450 [Paenibacillus filicis]|uniref:Uncharacterized protein n=1 Tax=Paenibacillus gyeongsangnamensis TaxID=3388067 RepID=A0ABT4Q3N6_9BACL|nr:hypothetical protein [Paenibacillus filicis]MCZ8511315.1 hypothetical protein [Paenibacillus filicis]
MYANHMNLAKEGQVYCCLRNKIVPLNGEQVEAYCSGCPMNKGVEPGKFANCYWNDARPIKSPHWVIDPRVEYISMQTRKHDAV